MDGGLISKHADSPEDEVRLAHEVAVLRHLEGNPHVPRLNTSDERRIEMDFIDGESFVEWLDFDSDTWTASPRPVEEVLPRLTSYVDAEMSLLADNVLYRDMNLNHLIFTPDRAVLVDLEAAVIKKASDSSWRKDSPRGTWETMAPEEFPLDAVLSERVASYRVAVLAHLALTGRLPFDRHPSKRVVYQRRQSRPPAVYYDLPRPVRKVIGASLQPHPTRRHKNPGSFLAALKQSIEYEQPKQESQKGRDR